MITPTELHKKAERLFLPFLAASIAGESFFPRTIPCRKPKPADDFGRLQQGIHDLVQCSKSIQGFGYAIKFKQTATRRHGEQSLPHKIVFEDAADFLQFLGKQREYEQFHQAVTMLKEALPNIDPWLLHNPRRILDYLDDWPNLLKVCRYFLDNPKPELYVRELPIDVHTKFIEQRQAILRSLLDFLLPADCVNVKESNFHRRFHLKYQEALIRVRLLDDEYARQFGFADVSLPESDFYRADFDCTSVFVVENLMTFLTLPQRASAIAIWGKGFQVELLKNANWLRDKKIYYWGDIDTQGFQMLSQVRGYFPQTQSLLMDKETFEQHKKYCVSGAGAAITALPNLTVRERLLFESVREHNLRLEQEKIHHIYVMTRLESIKNR